MKKKQRTAKEKVKRGKRALAILTCMGIVCLIAMIAQECNGHQAEDPVTTAMDTKLDSLLNEIPYINPKVIDIEQHKICRITPPCAEEDSLAILEVALEFGGMTDKEIKETKNRIDELKVIITEYHNDKNNEIVYHNRRLKFKTESGKTYTCIQTIDTNLANSKLKHILCLEDIEEAEKETKRLIQELS